MEIRPDREERSFRPSSWRVSNARRSYGRIGSGKTMSVPPVTICIWKPISPRRWTWALAWFGKQSAGQRSISETGATTGPVSRPFRTQRPPARSHRSGTSATMAFPTAAIPFQTSVGAGSRPIAALPPSSSRARPTRHFSSRPSTRSPSFRRQPAIWSGCIHSRKAGKTSSSEGWLRWPSPARRRSAKSNRVRAWCTSIPLFTPCRRPIGPILPTRHGTRSTARRWKHGTCSRDGSVRSSAARPRSSISSA